MQSGVGGRTECDNDRVIKTAGIRVFVSIRPRLVHWYERQGCEWKRKALANGTVTLKVRWHLGVVAFDLIVREKPSTGCRF